MMLIYGFNAEEKDTLDNIIKKTKLPSCKVIDKSMTKMTVNNILEGLRLGIDNITLPDEKVILFNNLSDYELDVAINQIRDNMDPMPILAAVTPMSINWEFDRLLNHLIEERDWFRKHQG